MKKNPRVSIIVLNFNGIEDTRVCLNSLLKTRYSNFEVLLVDNGSTINEAEILQKEYPDERIRFIRFKKNVGFTGGNNRALKKTSGKYVVLLNNDIFVRKDWLGHLVSALENDKKTAVAQPKILWAKDKRKFDYSGASGGFIDTFGYPFTRGRIFDTLEEDRGQYDNTREIFWASGAAFMFRKSILSKTNQLFDNQFFNYMEEVDLCWQLWSLGYRIVVVPNSVIYHKVAATTKKNLIKKRFYEHRNNLLLLVKNLPEKDLIKITLIRAFLEISTYFLYFFSGKFKFFLALFLAHLDFLRLLPSFLRKRRRRNTFPPHFEGSIALEYFIKKRRQFWQLGWPQMGGERTSLEFSYLYPTFNQHQAVYKFCQKFVKDKNTVDFGCGEGNGTFRLSEVASKAVGLDTSDKSIKSARRKYKSRNLKYYKADISNVRLDRKYDAAVCLQVIEHLDDPHKFLHSVKSALKPGGICIFSIPNKKTQGYNENPYHTREFQERELKELLEKYFKSVKIYGLFGDKYIQSYEKERKLQVMKFMKLDFLGIRKILPRKIKIAFFEFLVPFVRNNVAKKESGEFFKIGTSNYSVRSQTKGAIDFVALCKI